MKTLNAITAVLAFVALQSCGSIKDKNITYETFWVSGIQTECNAGAGKTNCLNVYKGNNLANATWENFYAPIQGFNYKKGTFQKIRVSVEKLDQSTLPADTSNLKYTLMEVEKTEIDVRAYLQGNWELTQLNDHTIEEGENAPILSIDLSKNKVSGNNSCNNYVADINNITAQTIELGNVATTRKICLDMDIATEYDLALNNIKTYQIKSDILTFFNTESKKVLSFKKQKNSNIDYRINDIWVATRIDGSPINRMVKAPRLEVNLADMKIMGNDGCNNYSGNIQKISGKDIEIGNIATTQKACQNMEAADRYAKALNNSITYKVEKGILTFFNKNNTETLSFLKID